jgi:hypothetical protein
MQALVFRVRRLVNLTQGCERWAFSIDQGYAIMDAQIARLCLVEQADMEDFGSRLKQGIIADQITAEEGPTCIQHNHIHGQG